MAETRLAALAAEGQSVWIDLLSREFVAGGELAALVADDSVTGLTSNPTIFQKAIAGGGYDEQIGELLTGLDDSRELFFELAIDDVRAACDVLAPVFDSARGGDGFVSLEVDPGLARDTQATIAQAADLHRRVDRRNLYVKIPATREGLPAIEESIAQGHPDQRYAHLLAGSLPGRRRRLPTRPRAAPGQRRRPRACQLRRLVLRLPDRHRDRPPPRRAWP